jgi:dTDP-glucose pyrophosphorylase
MDIVIAAAGKGTRLQQYRQDIPKHIIPIHGRPFLFFLHDSVLEAQYRRIIIVGGHHLDQLAQALQQYGHEDQIILVNQFEKIPEGTYGTACPLLACADIIQGDRFVYTMGDHLISARDLQHMQQSTRDLLVGVTEHHAPERYGVIEYGADNRLTRIIEKPQRPTSNDINVGLYTLTPDIIPIVRNLPASARQEYEVTDAINAVAATRPVRVVHLQDYWLDLGRPEDVASLEQFLQA